MNHQLSWLDNTKVCAFFTAFITLFNPSLGLAAESEIMPLPIIENENLLYINRQGNVIIDTKSKINTKSGVSYDYSSLLSDHFFYDGLAAIRVNKKWGYINTRGEIVISPRFSSPGKFRNGVAKGYSRGDKYIDRNGKQLSIQYDPINQFSEGLAPVEIWEGKGHLRGVGERGDISYIDQSGRVVFKTGDYFQTSAPDMIDFSEGLVVTNKGYVDKKGKVVISCDHEKFVCFPFSNGLAANYSRRTNKGGFVNKKGLLVIKRQFDRVGLFCEDVAVTKTNNKYTFIDKKGDVVANPNYGFDEFVNSDIARNYANQGVFSQAPCFSDGLVLVKANEKIGFMDKKGEIVISPIFSKASSFVGGAAFVMTTDNKWGWIDKTGAFIWKSK